jgi:hypothetical protein
MLKQIQYYLTSIDDLLKTDTSMRIITCSRDTITSPIYDSKIIYVEQLNLLSEFE